MRVYKESITCIVLLDGHSTDTADNEGRSLVEKGLTRKCVDKRLEIVGVDCGASTRRKRGGCTGDGQSTEEEGD